MSNQKDEIVGTGAKGGLLVKDSRTGEVTERFMTPAPVPMTPSPAPNFSTEKGPVFVPPPSPKPSSRSSRTPQTSTPTQPTATPSISSSEDLVRVQARGADFVTDVSTAKKIEDAFTTRNVALQLRSQGVLSTTSTPINPVVRQELSFLEEQKNRFISPQDKNFFNKERVNTFLSTKKEREEAFEKAAKDSKVIIDNNLSRIIGTFTPSVIKQNIDKVPFVRSLLTPSVRTLSQDAKTSNVIADTLVLSPSRGALEVGKSSFESQKDLFVSVRNNDFSGFAQRDVQRKSLLIQNRDVQNLGIEVVTAAVPFSKIFSSAGRGVSRVAKSFTKSVDDVFFPTAKVIDNKGNVFSLGIESSRIAKSSDPFVVRFAENIELSKMFANKKVFTPSNVNRFFTDDFVVDITSASGRTVNIVSDTRQVTTLDSSIRFLNKKSGDILSPKVLPVGTELRFFNKELVAITPSARSKINVGVNRLLSNNFSTPLNPKIISVATTNLPSSQVVVKPLEGFFVRSVASDSSVRGVIKKKFGSEFLFEPSKISNNDFFLAEIFSRRALKKQGFGVKDSSSIIFNENFFVDSKTFRIVSSDDITRLAGVDAFEGFFTSSKTKNNFLLFKDEIVTFSPLSFRDTVSGDFLRLTKSASDIKSLSKLQGLVGGKKNPLLLSFVKNDFNNVIRLKVVEKGVVKELLFDQDTGKVIAEVSKNIIGSKPLKIISVTDVIKKRSSSITPSGSFDGSSSGVVVTSGNIMLFQQVLGKGISSTNSLKVFTPETSSVASSVSQDKVFRAIYGESTFQKNIFTVNPVSNDFVFFKKLVPPEQQIFSKNKLLVPSLIAEQKISPSLIATPSIISIAKSRLVTSNVPVLNPEISPVLDGDIVPKLSVPIPSLSLKPEIPKPILVTKIIPEKKLNIPKKPFFPNINISKKDIVKGNYKLVVGKAGNLNYKVFNNLTLDKALSLGKKTVSNELSASFKILKNGEVLSPDTKKVLVQNLGKNFVLSKKQDSFVEVRSQRLSSSKEVLDIKKAKTKSNQKLINNKKNFIKNINLINTGVKLRDIRKRLL